MIYNSIIEHFSLKKLLADIPVHDSNFEALRKNLNSTQEVARQVPASLAERCNTDLNTYTDDINSLEKRWHEIKIRLEALAQELKRMLPQAEKGYLMCNFYSNAIHLCKRCNVLTILFLTVQLLHKSVSCQIYYPAFVPWPVVWIHSHSLSMHACRSTFHLK